MWKRADVNHKGFLDGKELDKFHSVLNAADGCTMNWTKGTWSRPVLKC